MFKIGQKVVCKNDKSPSSKGIVKGKIYEIIGFDKCEFCGLELILLKGIDSGSRKECICSCIPIFPTNAFAAYRFEPLIYNVKKEVVSTSEPVLLK